MKFPDNIYHILYSLLIVLVSGIGFTSCESDPLGTLPEEKPVDDDMKTEEPEPGMFLDESFDKVECDFSAPEEWIVGKDEKPSFSYSIRLKEEIEGDLKLLLTANIPGEDEISWTCSAIFKSPRLGENLEGKISPGGVPSPNFYVCKVYLNGRLLKKFNIICNFEEYDEKAEFLPDFYDFWEKALDDLRKVPMDPVMTLNKEASSPGFNVYDVRLQSAGDYTAEKVEIRGWYVEPVGKKNLGVQIMFCGLDDEDKIWDTPTCTVANDLALLNIFPRGQGPSRFGDRMNPYGYWLTDRMGDKDNYYYRGAYLDAARAVEFAETLPNVDKSKLFVSGGSQGGTLATAAAALSSVKLALLIPVFPINGNFPRYLRSVGSGWPNNRVKMACAEYGREYDQVVSSLSYFDTKNLATMITCPLLLQVTLQDPIAPAWNQAPILKNLPDGIPSHWSIHPENGHFGNSEMNREMFEMIDKYVRRGGK